MSGRNRNRQPHRVVGNNRMKRQAGTIAVYRLSRRQTKRAVTLIELIVSVTIGALVAMSAVSATSSLTRTRQTVEQRTRRLSSARRAMASIVGALRNVRRDPIRGRPVVVGTRGDRGRDSIDLLVIDERTSRPEGAESDQQEVSFYLQRRSGQAAPSLMRRQDHGLDDYPEGGGVATVVAEGVVGLSFEYFGEGEWVREWPDSMTRAPEAVRVTVSAISTNRPARGQRPEAVTLSTVVALDIAQATERPGQPGGSQGGGPPR